MLRIERELAEKLIQCDSETECLHVLLEVGLKLPGFDSGGTYRISGEGGDMTLTGHQGLSERFVEKVRAFPSDEAAPMLVGRKVVFFGHVDEFPPAIRDVMREEGLSSAAILPLMRRGSVVGSLHLASHHKKGGEAVGRMALENIAGLAQDAFETIAGRQEWLTTERHLRMAVQGTGLGVWKADLTSRRFYASARARAMHDVPIDRPLTVESAQQAIHPDDLPAFVDKVRRTMDQGGRFSLEYRTADGSRWVEVEAGYFAHPAPRFMGIVRDISSRKREDQRLQDAGRRLEEQVKQQTEELSKIHADLLRQSTMLQLALASSGAGLREVDFVGDRVLMDDRACFLFGYPPGTVVSTGQLIEERIHPESRGELLGKLASLQNDRSETAWEHDSRVIHPERGERWVHGRGSIVRDDAGRVVALKGIVIDVTERRQMRLMLHTWNAELSERVAERLGELEESRARYRMLSDAAVEGVVVSRQGVILDGNVAFARMLGLDVDEMVGRSVLDYVPPEEWEVVRRRIAGEVEGAYESWLRKRDGTVIPVVCNPRMSARQGLAVRVTVLRDLSEPRRRSRELEHQRAELNNHRALALVSEVNAGVVEQFRGPLARIGGQMAEVEQRLATWNLDKTEVLEVVDDIKADVDRMREIIEHLSLLADQLPVNLVSKPLDDLLGDLAPLLERETEWAGVSLVVGSAGRLPTVRIDVVQIKQVLANLVRNAVESCLACGDRPGVVTITAGCHGDTHAEISVRDNGGGLAPESMKQLFTPFFTTRRSGTGIGLRLCKTLMDAQGGTIRAENNPSGAGACFTIRIPLEMEGGP